MLLIAVPPREPAAVAKLWKSWRHRIPEWQLDCVKHWLIQEVLKRAPDADAWNLYRILSQPLQNLSCFTLLEMVTMENLNQAVISVCEALEAKKTNQCSLGHEWAEL